MSYWNRQPWRAAVRATYRGVRGRFRLPEVEWKMSRRDWLAVMTGSAGAFLAVLDIQIANASLREISSSLGLDFAEGGWISTSYLIAEIVVIPLSASLSASLGLGRCFIINGAGFVLSSMLCGAAWNAESMIVCRFVQGMFGGMLIPLAFQTVIVFMPPRERVWGMSLFGLTVTLAPSLGPTFSGYVTDAFSWRFAFFSNLIPGSLMIYMATKAFPATKPDFGKLGKIDYIGAALLGLSLGVATYLLEEGPKAQWLSSSAIRYGILTALLSFGAFVTWEWNRTERLLRFELLAKRNFSISCLVAMLTAASLYGGIFAVSLYLGQFQNNSASEIGGILMWVGLPQILVMPFVPWLMKRFDPRILIASGLGLFWISNWMNVAVSPTFGGVDFRYSLILRAIGQPLFLVPLSSVGTAGILTSESGSASALFNVLRNIGGSVGIALTGTILDIKRLSHLQENLSQLQLGETKALKALEAGTLWFRQAGSDAASAQIKASNLLRFEATRQATIEAFSDVFAFLTIIILLAILCSLAMRPTGKINAEISH